jgi:hypothetical protein
MRNTGYSCEQYINNKYTNFPLNTRDYRKFPSIIKLCLKIKYFAHNFTTYKYQGIMRNTGDIRLEIVVKNRIYCSQLSDFVLPHLAQRRVVRYNYQGIPKITREFMQ